MTRGTGQSDSPPKVQRAWQRMLSGRRLDLLDPSPLDIEIEDIAHGLARVARWNGQTVGDHAFSVAQHSLLVTDIAAQLAPGWKSEWKLAALLHDAPEYVVGDLISPFKTAIGDDYKKIELRLLGAVHRRFGLPEELPGPVSATIKRADRIAAFFEATELAGFTQTEARQIFGRPSGLDNQSATHLGTLSALETAAAQGLFLDKFEELSRQLSK